MFTKEFGNEAKICHSKKHIMISHNFVFMSDDKAYINIRMMRNFTKYKGHECFYYPHGQNYKEVSNIALSKKGHNSPGQVLICRYYNTLKIGAFVKFDIGVRNTDAALISGKV